MPNHLLTACLTFALSLSALADEKLSVPRGYSIPLIDLAGETQRQVIVDREPGQ
jgi:hypothetical protein